MSNYDYQFKTIIVGEPSVGKTCLIQRLVHDTFNPLHTLTIGVELDFMEMFIDGLNIKLQIWDTAGMEKFRSITQAYYRNSALVLIVFDLTNRNSFNEAITTWIQNVRAHSNKFATILLVGNKKDMVAERAVTTSEVYRAAQDLDIPYAEVSCVTGEGVHETFRIASTITLDNFLDLPQTTDFKKYGIKLSPSKEMSIECTKKKKKNDCC